jgi:beta-N-acetylhexosaminidase
LGAHDAPIAYSVVVVPSKGSGRGTRLVPFLVLAAAIAVACSGASTGPPSSAAASAPSSAPSSATSAGPSGSATPTPSPACASQKLAAMSEVQRVGQLFLLGVAGDHLSAPEKAAIQTYHLGSAWLYNWRTGGVAGIRPLTTEIQAVATDGNTGGVGFFIGADQEGGRIQRITGPGFSTIPSALDQGALPVDALQADAAGWGRELAAAGINLDFGPVMDVVPTGADASNAPIGALQREYGHDPATAGDHGAAVVRGMAQAGIATTLKHFPGLGRVSANTDTANSVVDTVTTANDAYLDSFGAGIRAGAPFVMVSLATYTAIDPNHQAVFSPAIIGDVLRGRLGFDGVVISDDLGAAAAVKSMSPADRATMFIAAGGDFIIVGGATPAGQMAAAVVDRANSDKGFAAQVDAAVLRVLRAKETYGLLRCG